MSADLPASVRDRSGSTSSPSPSLLDRREERDQEARTYYEEVIRLPGFGEQPQRCLARKPVGFCDVAGHVALASASPCETRRCPEHWEMWQKGAAVKIVARLAAYRHAQSGAGKRLLHVVDSPDPSRRWSARAFWDERSDSYDVVEEVGGRGGVTVAHPYRTGDEGDAAFRSAVERGEWDAEWGKWSFLRSEADGWAEMARFIEGGPHFHHLVAAEDFDPEAIPEGRTVKNIDSLERFHIRDMTGYRDMARRTMYLLSHGGYQPPGADGSGGRNTVTYWGEAHPNAFDPEEALTATEWDRIQRMAERAVTTQPSQDEGVARGEAERPECHREECDGRIVPLDELREWLTREEWVGDLDLRQRWILRGVVGWLEMQGDRPPPSSDEGRVREWLRQRGRDQERTLRADQTGLGLFET